MTDVTVTLSIIRDQIATAMVDCGREPTDIRLVAVSKTHPPAAVVEALEAGQREFAENYLQEAAVKIQTLRPYNAVWHYIGRIQRNKTRDIAACFDWVQTVDRARIATRLNDQRDPELGPLDVCIQLRTSDDPARPGADPQALPALAETIAGLPRLRLRGLMCMPPIEDDPAQARAQFDRTREIYDRLCHAGFDLDTLSMGTTLDFREAIEAGSTLVRVGTAIFGPREGR